MNRMAFTAVMTQMFAAGLHLELHRQGKIERNIEFACHQSGRSKNF